MKDSFVLLKEQRPAFDMLPDAEAGQLIKAVMAYSFDGAEPELPPMAAMAFAMLKPVIDRHAAKYQATCEARSRAGAKGGVASGSSRRKQAKQGEANEANASTREANEANASTAKPREANEHDNDCDCDYENEDDLHTPLPPSQGGGVCAPAPLSGEDIAEREDGARKERQRGDYEFSLLRDAYNRARQEGPAAGRDLFLELFHSQEWPGIDELIASVERLCAQDDQFRRGYAPGLAKFLRERMWLMAPRAPAGEGQGETPEQERARREYQEKKKAYLDGLKARKEGRKK